MSSGRALAALAAVAAALAAWLVVDVVGGAGEGAAGRLLPRLESEEPVRLEIERRGGDAVVLERAGEDGWQLRAPIDGPADPARVRALLGALELLESRRAAERALPGERGRVRLRWDGGAAAELAIGAEAAGGAVAWVQRAGEDTIHAVDAHGASEILASADELRGRQPFARLGSVRAIEVDGGRLELAPPRVRVHGGMVRASETAARELAAAARSVRIARFSDQASAPGPRARVAMTGSAGAAAIAVDGACEGGSLHVRSELGAGCVAGAELEPLLAIATDPAALVDRQLAPAAAIERVELERGGERAEVSIEPGQQEAARRWADALVASLTGEVVPAPTGEPIATARITGADASRELALYRDGDRALLRRDGEPIAFVAADEALRLFEPAPGRFRDLTLLGAEPTWIRGLTWRRGGEVVAVRRRGELLEDWRDAAGEPVDRARAEAAVRAAAPLRAESVRAEPPERAALTLEIELADPLGDAPPARRRFRLAGCAIQPEGDALWLQLDAERCGALAVPTE